MNAQVLARPAPHLTKDQLLAERLSECSRIMRSTAQFMERYPDPAPQHAKELHGASILVRMWIRDIQNDAA